MPRAAPIQGNFSGGEFSPLMYGRVDSDRYKTGLAVCQNYVPTVQGGIFRRPGTAFVSEVKDSTVSTRLEKFEFSVTQAYVLEFGNEYIRFYRDGGLVTTAPVTITNILLDSPIVVTAPSHGFSTGNRVIIGGVLGTTQVNGLEFQVTVIDLNTFSAIPFGGGVPTLFIGTPPYDLYISGGTVSLIYEVSTVYQTADLFQLKFTQSNDVIYVTHVNYAPVLISRTGNTSWTVTAAIFSDGPYLPVQPSPQVTTLVSAASSGTGINLTASATTNINGGAGFLATDVGRSIRLLNGTTWGWCVVDGYVDTIHVTVTIMLGFGTIALVNWQLGIWSATTGYPACATFHEDRLVFGGSLAVLQRVDGSVPGDYLNFQPTLTDDTGAVTAACAYSFNLNSNDVNAIYWLVSDEKGLLAGSSGAEWYLRPGNTDNAINPTNITAKNSTNYGSANVQALKIARCPMFIQRGGVKMREMNYNFYMDGFDCADMTVISEHITKPGVTQLAYQRQPQSVIWAVRADGQLLSMTYERDTQSVRAGWGRHVMGGASDAAGSAAVVESVTVIPSPDGTYDQVWVIVRRWIGNAAQSRRYVEYFTRSFDDTVMPQNAVCLDCSVGYDNPFTITAASQTIPVVLTIPGHTFVNGDKIRISGVLGMIELNDDAYVVANVSGSSLQLTSVEDGSNIDGTEFSAFVTGYTNVAQARKLVTTLTGLGFLEGQTVSIIGDGAVLPPQLVAQGKITMNYPATTVTVGIPYNSDGQLLRSDAGAADGTAFGKTRRTNRIAFLLHRTGGLQFGESFDELDTIIFRTSADAMSNAVPLFDGIISETITTDYDFDNQICWRQNSPLPGMILAVLPQVAEYDRS